MIEKEKIDRSIDFVTHFYRENAFVPDGINKILPYRPCIFPFASRRIAVAAAACAVLLASAAIGTWMYLDKSEHSSVDAPETRNQEIIAEEIRIIEFKDTPLKEVVNEIEATYGVTIDNVPSEEYRLTLKYEGTAADLIYTINELLGTELMIKQ